MIEKILLFFFGSILGDSEHPNQVNDKKLGMMVAGAVFTYYMVTKRPEGWEMWATFMGSIGGWNVGSYVTKKLAANKGKPNDPAT